MFGVDIECTNETPVLKGTGTEIERERERGRIEIYQKSVILSGAWRMHAYANKKLVFYRFELSSEMCGTHN